MTALIPACLSTMPVTKRVAIIMAASSDVAANLKARAALISYCKAGNLNLTAMFEASKDQRKFLLAAARNEFDVLLVSSVNALGIDLAARVKVVLELSAAGVELRSIAEPFLDFSTSTSGNTITSVLVWISEQQQAQAASKIKKGQEKARARNVKIGRPRKPVDVPRALMLLADGMPLSKVSLALAVSRSHLRRHLEAHQQVAGLRPNWPEGIEESPMTQQILRVTETHAEPQEQE